MFSTLQEVESFFKQRQHLGIKPGLERIHGLLNRLGNPENKMTAIHIAGTNGKGSTLHFLKAALIANDYEVGVFTSPSFHGLCGHILLNDKAILETELVALLNKAYPYIVEMDEIGLAPTEFEILTALAFSYFAENGEIVLVEAGMGGRFDTTNSFHPIMSIITNIALDHTDYLGESLEEIAYHKAGIIKQGSPVIIGKMEKEALSVLLKEAADCQASSYEYGKEFFNQMKGEEILWCKGNKKHLVKLTMKGEHQRRNVSLSLRALDELENLGFKLDWQKGISAIERTEIPGRFECIHTNPTVIVDAAHNPDGISAFIKTVQQQYPKVEKQVIVAMFRDKATNEMLYLLGDYFEHLSLTSFNHPRAWNPYEVANEQKLNITGIDNDYRTLIKRTIQKDKIYFITGSLHFITEVRRYFLRKK